MTDTPAFSRLLSGFAAVLALLITGAPLHAQQETLLDRIVAVVNTDVVLESELREEYAVVQRFLRARNIEMPPENILKQQVLDKLIIQKLQFQEAEKRGVNVDDTTLNEVLRQTAAQNKMSLEEFRRQLIADGKDYLEAREDIRKEIILSRLTQGMINSRVIISEAEIDDYIANTQVAGDNSEYLVSHIQISLPEAATADVIQKAEAKANSIHERLRNKANFEQLAIAESDGRDALQGGDLGWQKLSELPTVFATALLGLKPGEFTRPIRTPRGFHILILRDTKGIERRTIQQVNARHILITPTTLLTDDKVRAKLIDLRKQILGGADFAKLAKEHSDDPGSAAKGGELGWAEPGIFVPEFQRTLASLPLNRLSEPFKTQFGWHILEVLGKRDYDVTVEHQRHQARQSIYRRKAVIEEELWIRRLRDEAYIEYKLDS